MAPWHQSPDTGVLRSTQIINLHLKYNIRRKLLCQFNYPFLSTDRRPGGRRVSVEFEDLGVQSTTGKLLPPLRHGATKSCSRLSTCSNSMSFVSLRRAGSFASVRSTAAGAVVNSPGDLSGRKETHWLGDPSAIGSVRRPRKTLAQQRLDAMSRSNSVKENTVKCFRHRQTLSRSCSMKEEVQRASASPTSPSIPAAGDGFLHRRAKSLKESKVRAKYAVEPVSETLSSLDLSEGHQSQRSQHPSPMSYTSTSSPKDVSTSGDSEDGSNVHLIMKSPAAAWDGPSLPVSSCDSYIRVSVLSVLDCIPHSSVKYEIVKKN